MAWVRVGWGREHCEPRQQQLGQNPNLGTRWLHLGRKGPGGWRKTCKGKGHWWVPERWARANGAEQAGMFSDCCGKALEGFRQEGLMSLRLEIPALWNWDPTQPSRASWHDPSGAQTCAPLLPSSLPSVWISLSVPISLFLWLWRTLGHIWKQSNHMLPLFPRYNENFYVPCLFSALVHILIYHPVDFMLQECAVDFPCAFVLYHHVS